MSFTKEVKLGISVKAAITKAEVENRTLCVLNSELAGLRVVNLGEGAGRAPILYDRLREYKARIYLSEVTGLKHGVIGVCFWLRNFTR